MFVLVPQWAQHYGEFWKAIRLRNRWFIRLRYIAVFILLGFLLFGELILNLNLSKTQIVAIALISIIIFVYNVILQSVKDKIGDVPGKFNCLHFSLLQIVLDMTALMLLVYFTGMIDSPLYMLFIFHMIIGSLILPGYVVYVCAGAITFIFAVLDYLQRTDVLDVYLIPGLVGKGHVHEVTYDVLFITVFGFMLFVSVYLANKIARQLYRREQQLRRTLEKLEEAEESKQKYTIGVVHEIKSPIAALQSIIQLLLERIVGPIDVEVEKKLQRAKIRTDEVLALINNILRFSKLKLLDITSSEEVMVDDLIRSLIENHFEETKQRKIEFQIFDQRENKKAVMGDKILLELAFSNLISNSIKYSPDDSRVEITLSEKDAENILIEVSDTGIGIPQHDINKIFNQFYRASNIDKTNMEGSGMGLAIVKEIIDRHKGTIEATSPSKIGNAKYPGTTVTIRLPYKITAEIEPEEITREDY